MDEEDVRLPNRVDGVARQTGGGAIRAKCYSRPSVCRDDDTGALV